MIPHEWLASLPARVTDFPLSVWILVKLTLLLAAAWILHGALARANPQWRVLLWRGMAVAMVLTPAWIMLGPPVDVSVNDRTAASDAVATQERKAQAPGRFMDASIDEDTGQTVSFRAEAVSLGRADHFAAAAPIEKVPPSVA